jgi:hypothetical protein
MKIIYSENICRDKLNDFLFANIWFYILIKIMIQVNYDPSKLCK